MLSNDDFDIVFDMEEDPASGMMFTGQAALDEPTHQELILDWVHNPAEPVTFHSVDTAKVGYAKVANFLQQSQSSIKTAMDELAKVQAASAKFTTALMFAENTSIEKEIRIMAASIDAALKTSMDGQKRAKLYMAKSNELWQRYTSEEQ